MPEPSSSLAAAPSSDEDPEPRQRFSEVLSDLASRPSPTIAINDVLSAFGDRAFGALMLLFAAPNILPLPPGTSAVLGAPLLFITAQLMLGRPTLWMPAFIRERSIQRDFFALLTAKLSPVLARGERFLKPRLPFLLHPAPERLVGAACLLLAIILFLPIPFGNIPPAFAISAFALGILERDGMASARRLDRNDRQRPDPRCDFVRDPCRNPRLSRPVVGSHRMTRFVQMHATATFTTSERCPKHRKTPCSNSA